MVETHEKGDLEMAKVDFGGLAREVFLDNIPKARGGQHCSIHVGSVVSILNGDLALERSGLLKQIVLWAGGFNETQ